MSNEAKYIDIQNVEQTFKTRKGSFPALRDINLTVAKGEFVTLIGHSGCGKSTLLNLIAGLTTPTNGVLLCADREIAGPGPERAVVFQNHSLLPWLTCFENVYLAVERVFAATESKAQLKQRTEAALALVGLTPAAQKRPGEISGGMKQRVGIARALSMEPKVLLMDEPFGALDALTRAKLQDELLDIVAATHATVVMVTHVDEAVLPSDKIDDDQRAGPPPSAKCRRGAAAPTQPGGIADDLSTCTTEKRSSTSSTRARRTSKRQPELTHPRRASRDPLKGATLAARQSRFRGVLGSKALRSGKAPRWNN
jgi:nitrate/nitrite transport system ATP-binding protein